MLAPVCVTLAGDTHASMLNSPVPWIMLASLALALVEPWALPPCVERMPQPPTQVTLPDRFRSSSGVTPLVS